MHVLLTCHPPLGQTTTIGPEKTSVRFTVLIESFLASEKTWEVALWHNLQGQHQWTSLRLESVVEPSVTIIKPLTHLRRQYFSIELPGRPEDGTSLSYTVTFRASENDPWKWANDNCSTSDGRLIYQPMNIQGNDLDNYIDELSSLVTVSKELCDTPDTILWSITSPVDAASGKTPGNSSVQLGIPSNMSRWFALVRLWGPWIAPRQGKERFQPDKQAIMAAFERHDGVHLIILAVSGIDDVLTTLHHDGNGRVVFNTQNDAEKKGVTHIIAAVGKSSETALAAAMQYARKLVMKHTMASDELSAEMDALTAGFKPNWLQNWFDGLAFCTWNSIGQNITEEKLSHTLALLAKNNINVSSLIIDDGWQSVSSGDSQFQTAWLEFEADKKRFPRGLKATVGDIREKYKNIKHVAVWHALFGYWGGIAPEGRIAREYKTKVVQLKNGISGGKVMVVSDEDVDRLYKDFYTFLSESGVDSVKTDAQFFVDEVNEPDDRRHLIRAYQDAWSIAQLRHLSARAISCMSQTPQIMFHSLLPTNKPRILFRNTDDFFPDIPASHPWHIFCNAHNSIFTQHLNILPDWDMFQTSHNYAAFHAAGRCVSGGPVYITDVAGQHDLNLIAQMTGNTPRGDTVILRPHTVGRSTSAYNAYDDAILLKIATHVGKPHTGISILGIFNCTSHPLAELIGLDAFPGAEKGRYIIRSHTDGQITAPTSAEANSASSAFVHLELPVRGWEILSAFPLLAFKLQRQRPAKGPEDITIANLGVLGKMTGAAAIVDTSSHIDGSSGRLRIWTSLKVLGTFGLYVSDLKQRSIEDDFFGVIFGRPIPRDCVKRSAVCEDVLEIDVARAWEQTDSKASWSNEVVVEVVIR